MKKSALWKPQEQFKSFKVQETDGLREFEKVEQFCMRDGKRVSKLKTQSKTPKVKICKRRYLGNNFGRAATTKLPLEEEEIKILDYSTATSRKPISQHMSSQTLNRTSRVNMKSMAS